MTSTTTTTALRLTRNQLVDISKDPEVIRQLELLIARVNALYSGEVVVIGGQTKTEADAEISTLTSKAGARATITDSTLSAAANFAAVVVGGGSFTVPAWHDGTDWRIG
jgi:hypothetical protein